ncbi:hypothetical protein AAFG07_00410 [Bradyrhizobium sp. B097]|uniref:hypothetical protein n=1 Tax=Bradyrhizobium sp. B097 TaxID=3140244 RepID=UPI0031841594
MLRWSSLPPDVFRVLQIGSGVYLATFIVTHLNTAFVSARAVHSAFSSCLGISRRGCTMF